MEGFYRIAAAVPRLHLGDPERNAEEILPLIARAEERRCALLLLPELCLTGYSLSDLFFQQRLYLSQEEALARLVEASKEFGGILVAGFALRHADRLYNCAAVIQSGRIAGIVPKTYLPDKREYYEKRQFSSSRQLQATQVTLLGSEVPVGTDLLFVSGELILGVEICEDLWAPTPPSNALAEAGANLIVNPSASNELVGKADYRAELVRTQSARLLCAYAYASAGVGESGTDTVFGGDSMIAEYGTILARGERFATESRIIDAEIDLQRLGGLRLAESAYGDAPARSLRRIELDPVPAPTQIERFVDPHPFVPSNPDERARRCREITAIQAHALRRRMEHSGSRRAVLGISGGLDSTLALLATREAFRLMERDPRLILAVTMPGPGTSARTRNNAQSLCEALGVELREIPIGDMAAAEMAAIGHDPELHDVTYENIQARLRTQILMNLANQERGLVVGTGDLSEIALGWSTYNGDHMSMYALNAGIPKTLVRYLVEYYACEDPRLERVLHDILDTPVSPELLPAREGEISQKTEEIVGPYELHDFFLYHFLKYGAPPRKILGLAALAFEGRYDEATIRRWLLLFLRRFFSQQFKRSCMPDGPKVGTVSLSPRADWRMPSDATAAAWIRELEGE